MPKFEITARNQMSHNGLQVVKGESYVINIPMTGLEPYNLFTNSRCKNALYYQLKELGLEPAPGSPWLTQGNWDVKMIR